MAHYCDSYRFCLTLTPSHIQIRDAEGVVLDEFAARVDLVAHQPAEEVVDLVLTVLGIGERTALAIVVRVPELGQIRREEAAALAGLAPSMMTAASIMDRATSPAGAAASAAPSSPQPFPQIKAFYERLVAAGKPHNLALTACARKLLVYANTVVQRGTPWTEQSAQT